MIHHYKLYPIFLRIATVKQGYIFIFFNIFVYNYA